jgi:excisionase family DNA binding protein
VTDLEAIFAPELAAALKEAIREEVEAELERHAGGRNSDRLEYLSVAEAAGYLGCADERVRKLAAAGKLPYYQESPGARIFFRRSDLDEAMQEWRVEARP